MNPPMISARLHFVQVYEERRAARKIPDNLAALIGKEVLALKTLRDEQRDQADIIRRAIRIGFSGSILAGRGQVDNMTWDAFTAFEEDLASAKLGIEMPIPAPPAGGFAQPGLALLSKLASIAVHVTEMRSSDGHLFDQVALDSLLADREVQEWLSEMGAAALAPLPRKPTKQREPGL